MRKTVQIFSFILIFPSLCLSLNMLFQAVTILTALAATASAHGYVETVTAGGVTYIGSLVRTINITALLVNLTYT